MSRFSNNNKDVMFTFNSKPYMAKQGDNISAALVVNNIPFNRKTHGNQTARSSFCHMGVCFECLVQIDGISGIQACKTQLSEGMEIKQDV